MYSIFHLKDFQMSKDGCLTTSQSLLPRLNIPNSLNVHHRGWLLVLLISWLPFSTYGIFQLVNILHKLWCPEVDTIFSPKQNRMQWSLHWSGIVLLCNLILYQFLRFTALHYELVFSLYSIKTPKYCLHLLLLNQLTTILYLFPAETHFVFVFWSSWPICKTCHLWETLPGS